MADGRAESETGHPRHFGCVLSLRDRVTRCWRFGMCATQGLGHVQRDTTSDGMLALGHSRSGLQFLFICKSLFLPGGLNWQSSGFRSGNSREAM
jgi:hypothetical protein